MCKTKQRKNFSLLNCECLGVGDTVLSNGVFLCLDSGNQHLDWVFQIWLILTYFRNIYASNLKKDLKTEVRMDFFKVHSMQLYFQQNYFLPFCIKLLNKILQSFVQWERLLCLLFTLSLGLFIYNSVNHFCPKSLKWIILTCAITGN